jgi:hypothetical protein
VTRKETSKLLIKELETSENLSLIIGAYTVAREELLVDRLSMFKVNY